MTNIEPEVPMFRPTDMVSGKLRIGEVTVDLDGTWPLGRVLRVLEKATIQRVS